MTREVTRIKLSPEEDRRILEEYRASEVIGIMREKDIDEESANRYFAVMQTVRNFQSRVAAGSRIPYDCLSFNLKFDWHSESVDPLRRYPYKIDKNVIIRQGWAFEEIRIDGYSEDDSPAFTARVIFFAVPIGGDIRHQH